MIKYINYKKNILIKAGFCFILFFFVSSHFQIGGFFNLFISDILQNDIYLFSIFAIFCYAVLFSLLFYGRVNTRERKAPGKLSIKDEAADIMTQKSLWERNWQLDQIIENAPFPIMVFAEDGEIQTINKMWTELSGYDLDGIPTYHEWAARAFSESPEDVENHIDAILDADECLKEGVLQVRTASKRIRYWELSALSLGKLPDERRLGAIMAVDITCGKKSEAKIQNLTNFPKENPNPMLQSTLDGRLLYSNPAASDLLRQWGTQVGDMLPLYWYQKLIDYFLCGFTPEAKLKIGKKVYAFQVSSFSDDSSLFMYGRDITEQVGYEEELKLCANVYENVAEGIIITDKKGIIQQVNPAFTKITGYLPEEVIGHTPELLKSGKHEASFFESIWDTVNYEGVWIGEVWNRRKNGESYPQRTSITAISDKNGEATHFVEIFHDISDAKRIEADLKDQAYHDDLTGLYNRNLFDDRLEKAISHAKRKDEKLSLLFLDLDNFKSINDTMGHHIGDQLLKEVADRLKSSCRDEDTIARIGGDEFALILPEIQNGWQDAIDVARRIIQSIGESIQLEGNTVQTSTSIGIAIYPTDTDNSADLKRYADIAMYRAKDSGKNTYELYTDKLGEVFENKLKIEESLRGALEKEQFYLHYQPIIDIHSGRIVGNEAFIRWEKSPGNLILPGQFISLTEKLDLISKISRWVLYKACIQTLRWQRHGYEDLYVSVNLSSKQLISENIVDIVREVLRDTGFDGEKLILDITEDVLVNNPDAAASVLGKIKALGVKIALDDYGTGALPLNLLKKVPLDFIKIDCSLIHNIYNNDDSAIVKSIIDLSRNLKIKTIAECVEQKDQFIFLKKNRCHEVQGNFICEPSAADELDFSLWKGRPRPSRKGKRHWQNASQSTGFAGSARQS